MGIVRRAYCVKAELTEEGTFKEFAADGAYRETIPGLPGLARYCRRGVVGPWKLHRTVRGRAYSFVIPVATLEALRHRYVEWEIDPEAYERKYSRAGQPNLKDALAQWVREKQAEKKSDDYIEHSLRNTERFFEFCSWRARYTVDDAKDYAHFLSQQPLSPNTVGLYLTALKVFFTFCEQNDYHPNIFRKVKLPARTETRLDRRRIITEPVLLRMVEFQSQLWAKHAMIACWSMGLRINEMWGVMPGHVKLSSGELFVPPRKKQKGPLCADPR